MSSKSEPVGVVGLGLVGAAVAARLMESGREVVGTDVDQSRVQKLTKLGGLGVEGFDDVLANSRTVLLCLPTSRIVSDVLQRAGDALRPDHLVIDMTTGDPEEISPIAESLNARRVGYIEAKIAGSSQQLRRGEAILLVAGEKPLVAAAHPLLADLSQRWFDLGPTGAASRFKLVHNLILGLNRAALAEGLRLAEALGFDAAEAVSVLSQTPANSHAMETKGNKMATAEFSPQATLSQHLKDVRLILSAAERAGAHVPLSELHRQLLEEVERAGYGDADNSAIVMAFKSRDPNQG